MTDRKMIYLDDAIDALAYFTEKSPTGRTAQEVVKDLPSAQPEERTEERTETHACDCISRQAAIDAICDNCDHVEAVCPHYPCKQYIAIENLPSAQPEIIRCKDCEWFRKEYGWNCIEYTVCGISPTHHPIRGEEDFCSYAERREE